MAACEEKSTLAYWLMPAESSRTFFASIIEDLARRFDAPTFEPHVTIYITAKNDDIPAEILSRVLNGLSPLRLSPLNLQYSDSFTKTLFVQFKSSPLLTRLSDALREASVLRQDYPLDPHLSLIYKKLDTSTKIDLLNSIRLPFNDVLFDHVQTVICPFPTESREDVERWRITAKQEINS